MGIELPHEDDELQRGEPDPTYTGARPLLDSPPLSGEWTARSNRAGRASVRPSAFGLPRVSASSIPPSSSAATTPRASEAVSTEGPVTHRAPERLATSMPVRKRARSTGPVIKTDIEQLLPISQRVKSLPNPPRLPVLELAQPSPAHRRIPWLSVAVFAFMLLASAASLLHYTTMERPQRTTVTVSPLMPPPAAVAAPPARAATTGASAMTLAPLATHPQRERDAVRRIESSAWGRPDRVQDALLLEAERALEAGDERMAEALFARMFVRDPGSARAAHGLARVRMLQGDLEGAEGWVQSAIDKQPRDAAYRALHADILERRGRVQAARFERTLARAFARRARHAEHAH